MCLVSEWNLLIPGIVLTSIGGVILITIGIIAFIKNKKASSNINWKLVGKISYAVVSALVLGLGMCMIMVWDLMIAGIIVGIVGILMLLFIIPMFFGLKN
ncbi:MAG: hypothetical protein ACLRFL_03075, partial [Clostridia bacterium]